MRQYDSLPFSAVTTSISLRTLASGRVGIGHALVDNCSSGQVYASIIDHARKRGEPAFVITPNAQHIVLLEKDEKFRRVYNKADLVIADGISLLFAARLFGRMLQERIAGVDAFHELCGLAAAAGLKVFLLGGRPGSADLAAAALRREYPGLCCATYCPPYGFDESAEGLKETAAAVLAASPHLLFVGFGAPRQEFWIHDHGLELGIPVSIGIGGSFEMIGGVVRRAPVWIQKIACEWIYRVCREPRRLWKRYLIGNFEFADIVLRQRFRRLLLNACLRLAAANSFEAELDELSLEQGNTEPSPATVNQSERMVDLLRTMSTQERHQSECGPVQKLVAIEGD